jgi:hypothetical protein
VILRSLAAWLKAFLFTEMVEVPLYMRALGVSLPVAFGASALTHPIVWFVFFSPRFTAGYGVRSVAAELFAWLAEGAYFRFGWKCPRAWRWSFCANAGSLTLGLVSRHYLGVP